MTKEEWAKIQIFIALFLMVVIFLSVLGSPQ